MSPNTARHGDRHDTIEYARCIHLKEMLEPWSIRRLAARTGMTKYAVESIYTGSRDIGLSDMEAIAPVLRMTAAELAQELLSVEPPTRSVEYRRSNVTPIVPRRTMTHAHTAVVTPIRRGA